MLRSDPNFGAPALSARRREHAAARREGREREEANTRRGTTGPQTKHDAARNDNPNIWSSSSFQPNPSCSLAPCSSVLVGLDRDDPVRPRRQRHRLRRDLHPRRPREPAAEEGRPDTRGVRRRGAARRRAVPHHPRLAGGRYHGRDLLGDGARDRRVLRLESYPPSQARGAGTRTSTRSESRTSSVTGSATSWTARSSPGTYLANVLARPRDDRGGRPPLIPAEMGEFLGVLCMPGLLPPGDLPLHLARRVQRRRRRADPAARGPRRRRLRVRCRARRRSLHLHRGCRPDPRSRTGRADGGPRSFEVLAVVAGFAVTAAPWPWTSDRRRSPAEGRVQELK